MTSASNFNGLRVVAYGKIVVENKQKFEKILCDFPICTKLKNYSKIVLSKELRLISFGYPKRFRLKTNK